MTKRLLPPILIIFMVCGGSSAAQLDARPKVRVTFVVEAAGIRKNLKSELLPCVTTVQDKAQQDLQKRFPFFEWTTSGEATHTLVLTLSETQTSFDIEHVLSYTASIGNGNAPVHVIYPVEDPPVVDVRSLKDDVIARTIADVARAESELKNYFTRHVPLVRRLDIEKRSILLPVADVHPMRALFLVDFQDAAAKRGTIQLFKPQDQPAGIYCEIAAFQFLPDIPETTWDDRIPGVIKRVRKAEVKVQEFTPRPYANTSDRSVTTLREGRR